MYKLIAFDGDDTLWHNEPLFREAHVQLREMLGHYVDPEKVDDRLYQAELANLSIYGYGVTGFTLSMIETAIELSDRKISAEDIHKLAEIGKSMLRAPTRIIDGAESVLKLCQGSELQGHFDHQGRSDRPAAQDRPIRL